MVSGKNRIGEVIKVSTAPLTQIPLTLRLSLILAAFDHPLTVTLGAANTRFPAHLAHRLVAFGIVYQMREVQVEHGSRGSVSQLNAFYLVPSASISLQHLLSQLRLHHPSVKESEADLEQNKMVGYCVVIGEI
jgi:hypothetical protein